MKKILFSILTLITYDLASAQSYIAKSLTINLEKDNLSDLKNILTNSNWNLKSGPIFQVTGAEKIKTKLTVKSTAHGELQMFLTIENPTERAIMVEPVFPAIQDLELKDGNPEELYYLFPSQGMLNDNTDNVKFDVLYSSRFPLQFMNVYDLNKGGIYVMSQDTTNYPKRYYLNKRNGKVSMGIRYRSKKLLPGEKWTLSPVVIGGHQGDWHNAFYAYRNWITSWYKPFTPRKQWFQDIYNFRQVFLGKIFGEDGAFNPVTKDINIIDKVNDDKKAFGGIDYVHIFDWGETPESGRLGDYSPWKYLGGKDKLQQQISLLNQSGIFVGIYINGYRINQKSQIGKEKAFAWQQVDRNGGMYTKGTYFTVCPLVDEWRNYLTSTVERSFKETGAQGVYIDRFGFGWQYGCHNLQHQHDTRQTPFQSEIQVSAEASVMRQIRSVLPQTAVTYTEEKLTDVASQFQDGSFSYTIRNARKPKSSNPAAINLFRFAIPDFKLFELFQVDEPFGNDVDAIRRTFFNGEGLWIEGPLSDPNWFPEDVRAAIRKTYNVLSKHKDAFRSMKPLPLVKTEASQIYANLFPADRKNLWTIFNANTSPYKGKVIVIPHKKGAIYFDEFNNKTIKPEIKGGNAILTLNIEGSDIGCITQIW